MTLFDTAPFYGYGRSEMRIGHFLRERPRESYVLATKVGRWLQPLDRQAPPSEHARFDYGAVPEHIATRVRALQATCERHGVSLIAAALQFPLAHPCVTSVIPGAMTAAEQKANMAAMNEHIPRAFWCDPQEQKLVRADAPVPE